MQRLAGASLLVFANKQDIEGALTSDEIREVRIEICDPRCAAGARGALSAALTRRAQELELDQITTRHWRIGGCSAFTGAGLASGVDWIVQDIASRIFMYD